MEHTKLPDCLIINELEFKSECRKDINFNYISILDSFREKVSNETKYINLLFDEYTPHDEENHFSRLFHNAQILLGENLIKSLNATELFILSLSLYGHDWGMAISKDEKEYILSKGLKYEKNISDFCLISDEWQRLFNFATDEQIPISNITFLADIPLKKWRDYIRKTHGDRSGARIRKYFDTINNGVGEAAARVCEGHLYDFEKLNDYQNYPISFSVLNENINIKALTIYLRLIDLLDISEQRTPFILWKFINPRDLTSKLEWQKHRALYSITTREYLLGRVILVTGGTDDYIVYASLTDLRILCENELNQCNNLLDQMNIQKYFLDLKHVEWNVDAKGFVPISIQFEFDRKQMFNILSDEIYDNDSKVFIRELLQNSIDAIHLRRKLLNLKQINFIGQIDVSIDQYTNGMVVTIKDDGIGMDEYIIKNYLSIAGKSYYRSNEFIREGLNIDSISRFGIGILSCFMVAEGIEIETHRDQYISNSQNLLKIKIPSVDKQFRIESVKSTNETPIGTKINIYINNEILDRIGEEFDENNLVEYIKTIAGFVDIPILIKTKTSKVLVINNEYKDTYLNFQKDNFEIHSIDLEYPTNEIFEEYSSYLADELFLKLDFDLKIDLKLENVNGSLSYMIPKQADMDLLMNDEYNFSYDEAKVINRSDTIPPSTRFNWSETWTSYTVNDYESEVFNSRLPYKVYLNGILLSNPEPPDYEEYELGYMKLDQKYSDYLQSKMEPEKYYFPVPQLIANFENSEDIKINISRSKIQNFKWYDKIFHNHLSLIYEKYIEKVFDLNPIEKIYSLCRLIIFHYINIIDLFESTVFNNDLWPIPFITESGSYIVQDFKDCGNIIYLFPAAISDELSNYLMSIYFPNLYIDKYLKNWKGEKSMLFSNSYKRRQNITFTIDSIINFQRFLLNANYEFTQIKFVYFNSKKIIYQEIFERIVKKPELFDVIRKDFKVNPYNASELRILNENVFEYIRIPKIVKFSSPYEKYAFVEWDLINSAHEVGIFLLTIYTRILKKTNDDDFTTFIKKFKYYYDILPFVSFSHYGELDIDKINDNLSNLIDFLIENGILDQSHKDFSIKTDFFIPEYFECKENHVETKFILYDLVNVDDKFGNAIK